MANGNRRSPLFIIVATVVMLISFGKGTYEQCVLRNTVVYEGELNTLLSCSNGPNGTSIVVRATSSSSTATQIDSFNDTVAPALTGLYAINETGLIIRNATTLPTGGPISTAGFYIVSLDPKNSTNRTAFKLIVIRSGPTCYCSSSSSSQLSSVNISCQIIYADHPSYPINAVMSCSSPANGQSYNTTTPTKTLIPATPTQYVWNSTSTVTVNNPEPATYDCVMAFGKPGGAPPSYVALNAPDFSVNTQVFCGETTTASPTTTTQRTTTAQASTTKAPSTIAATTTQQTTTAEPPSTVTRLQVTTTKPPTTLTIPFTTTVQPSTTVIRQLTTTAESLSSTVHLSSTTIIIATQSTTPIIFLSTKSTAQTANATTLEPTTAKLTTTTTNQELASTPSAVTNASERPASSSSSTSQSSSTSSEFKSTTEEELTTLPLASAPTTSSIDVRLQSATIALATILATLMASVAALVGCFGIIFCCPLFSPIKRPTRFIVDEMQRRREWIPAAREIRRLEFRVIPFYRQSFCKCPTPYEYRLPMRSRCA